MTHCYKRIFFRICFFCFTLICFFMMMPSRWELLWQPLAVTRQERVDREKALEPCLPYKGTAGGGGGLVPPIRGSEGQFDQLTAGGRFVPRHCQPREELAVLVPVRGRQEALQQLLPYLHYFLQQQNKSYTIYVVEQTERGQFNKGSMFNAGILEAQKRRPADCFVLHDVDSLPLSLYNDYSCIENAIRQLLRSRSNENFRTQYDTYAGGVIAVPASTLRRLNGYSNHYWGWGAEDDDFSDRAKRASVKHLLMPLNISRYDHPRHEPAEKNPHRYKLQKDLKDTSDIDGLNSVQYTVVDERLHQTHTWLLVDLPNSTTSLDPDFYEKIKKQIRNSRNKTYATKKSHMNNE